MADAVRERRSRLALDHMSLLNLYAAALREEGRGFVPDFDPLDGGTAAKVLFLMEKPGPMTDGTALARRIGSGFISRDNDDPTAEAIFRFAESARLARERSILWNIVPWWNGTRTIGKGELQAGLARLEALIELLPNLQVVIAVGRRAERARRVVEFRGLHFIRSLHPSPINRAARPREWQAISETWAEARRFLDDDLT